MFGWVAICAGICIIMPQIIMGIVVFYNNAFVIERWHSFLIYQALNVTVLVYNLFLLPKAAWTHNIGCWYFLPSHMSLANNLSSCIVSALLRHLFHYMSRDCRPQAAK